MTKRTQTERSFSSHEHPWFNQYSPDAEPRSESRIRKWGKRVLAGTLLSGTLVGGGIALDKYTEVAQMNERFEPVLKPAAEETARFVICNG